MRRLDPHCLSRSVAAFVCFAGSVLLSAALAQDSVVVFNEIHYRPLTEEADTEWIELHNQMGVDVDVSGWRLRGGISFDFPEGTIVAGGGFVVVAAEPERLEPRSPFLKVLGPFAGRLDNAGETLWLEDRSTVGTAPGQEARHRVMDRLTYTGDALAAELVGFTWAKIDPDGGTAPRENWTASREPGGTPGVSNALAFDHRGSVPHPDLDPGAIVINEILYRARPQPEAPAVPGEYETESLIGRETPWRVHLTGTDPPDAWYLGEADWDEALSPFAAGLADAPFPVRTEIPLSSNEARFISTHYFAHTFAFQGDAALLHDLALHLYVDDGAVIYLNGSEIHRVNMPEGPVPRRTSAVEPLGDPKWIVVTGIDANRLRSTDNVLAVALHQHFTLFTTSDDAAFAAELTARTLTKAPVPAVPHRESEEEWLELYNRSDETVDLSGWRLREGIDYAFEDGDAMAPGAYRVIDAFAGTLSNGGEEIVLVDAEGRTIDSVRYRDNGRWPAEADGDGSSLELRDPDADNRKAESWAASDERERSSWHTYTYEGVAEDDGIGTSLYHEIVLGMLDAGEILLDDVSVIEDPRGESVEMMQNGDFEQGDPGEMPLHWLAVGTHGSHGRTRLVDDPDRPGNQVLHLVTTGATEDKHNQLTSVYADGDRIRLGQTYRISYRAKWLAGSNQLNSRLYFNYLQRTTRLRVPPSGGTPGAANSTLTDGLGPSLQRMRQEPVRPAPQQAVEVRIFAADPDGIAAVELTYAINGGTLFSGGTHGVTMVPEGDGFYGATIPGRPLDDRVRIHVTATDRLGNVSHFPREGADARALYEVGAPDDPDVPPYPFRVLMEREDREFLFADANRMSNDRIRGTVIYRNIAYYNVGIRLKGSAYARNNAAVQGLNIRFDAEQAFRGVHETVALERDPGKGEILAHHLFYAAGGKLPSYYSDVVGLEFDRSGFTGPVLLLTGRTSGPFLRGSFDNASAGTVYNLELLYTPQATIGRRPESPKQPFPYTHDNGRYDFRILGPDKEAYRWGFQIRSSRDRDDYSAILRASRAMEQEGLAFDEATAEAFDIDQWARAFAMMALNGNDDFYTRLWEHNLRLYHRPEDDRLLALPWDFDRAWRLGTSSPLIGKLNNQGTEVAISRLLERPVNRRLFQGHLLDILDSVYNVDYIERWADHYGSLFRSNLGGVTGYVRSRASYARRQLPDPVAFAISTNGGDDFTVEGSRVTLQGRGWIDVHEVRHEAAILPLTWVSASSWTTELPLSRGANPIVLRAYDRRGREVGSDGITLTGAGTTVLARADNLTITEIHYHPAEGRSTEFVELWNSSDFAIDLFGARFNDGIAFSFGEDSALQPGESAVLVQDRIAFHDRYPATVRILGEYDGRLNNGGERLRLVGADGSLIVEITYDNSAPWPEAADGEGPSLILQGGEAGNPAHWRASDEVDGNPGATSAVNARLTYPSWRQAHGVSDDALADADRDGLPLLLEYAFGGDVRQPSGHLLPVFDTATRTLQVFQRKAAEDLQFTIETASDLRSWSVHPDFQLVNTRDLDDDRIQLIYEGPLNGERIRFARVRVTVQ